MIYLLDTNAISDLMREHPHVDARLAALAQSDVVITCTIARGEILYGVERLPEGKRRRLLEAKATDLLSAIPCESNPPAAADHYARVKTTREKKGLALDENDLWITSTALYFGAVLVSRDTDVRLIEGLTVQDWTS